MRWYQRGRGVSSSSSSSSLEKAFDGKELSRVLSKGNHDDQLPGPRHLTWVRWNKASNHSTHTQYTASLERSPSMKTTKSSPSALCRVSLLQWGLQSHNAHAVYPFSRILDQYVLDKSFLESDFACCISMTLMGAWLVKYRMLYQYNLDGSVLKSNIIFDYV